MKSLTHYIALTGVIILIIIFVLGVRIFQNIATLRTEHRHLTEHILVEHQFLEEYQDSLYQIVISMHAFEHSLNESDMQEAQEALTHARALLPKLDQISQQIETDVGRKDRQAQRVALLEDAATQVERAGKGLTQHDITEAELAFQRLNRIAEESSTLSLMNHRLLDTETTRSLQDINQSILQVQYSSAGTITLFVMITMIALFAVRFKIVEPLKALLARVKAAGEGDLNQTIARTSRHEIGQLQDAFNTMVASLYEQQLNVQRHNDELQQANQRQASLLETISALSSPILPVLEGVLVMPIVGHMDEQRSNDITRTVLRAVHQQQARVVILDITGIAGMNAIIIQSLLGTIRATRLLGAHVYVAGISADFAHIIVTEQHGQVDMLETLHSFATLRDALEMVIRTA